MLIQVPLICSLASIGSCTFIWQSLNQTVQGRLHTAAPLSLPCFSTYNGQLVSPNPSICAEIQAGYTSGDFRAQFYNGFANNQDEICASNDTDQCLLNNNKPTDPTAFTNKSCNQGSVSKYYIEVQSESDVRAALEFSRNNGIRLSIKNSGHDYLGRSSLKGSLALWTRQVGGLTRDGSFVPDGCENVSAVDTITTAAGVNSDEAYKFADAEGVTLVGGYASTIGITGGWVQGGGHSVLSPVYGLGIDRVVQYKIITTDGVLRIANSCQNPDLFWALRGGGGGTFGVVMEATHRVEPAISLSVASIKYTQTLANIGQWLDLLVNNSLGWANQGWGGHYVASNLVSVTPLLKFSDAEASMAPAAAFAKANNGTVVIESLPSWYAFYTKYVKANEAAVGGPRVLASRLIPASLFDNSAGRAKLLSFLNHIVSVGLSPYIPATAPWLYPYPPNSTSATPAWRNAVWELGFAANWAWNSTLEEKKTVNRLLANLTAMAEELTPGGGTYVNEASPWTTNWREAWWGDNYPRLLAVKKKYDPEGILSCWKCVGFEDEEAGEKFPCFAGLDT
jgi:FAD/FMN-containing dehydrogenase